MRSEWQPRDDGPTPQDPRNSTRREMPEGTKCIEAESFGYFQFGGSYRLSVKTDETDPSGFEIQLVLVDPVGRQYRMWGHGRRER